jgi:hypothetical protein
LTGLRNWQSLQIVDGHLFESDGGFKIFLLLLLTASIADRLSLLGQQTVVLPR